MRFVDIVANDRPGRDQTPRYSFAVPRAHTQHEALVAGLCPFEDERARDRLPVIVLRRYLVPGCERRVIPYQQDTILRDHVHVPIVLFAIGDAVCAIDLDHEESLKARGQHEVDRRAAVVATADENSGAEANNGAAKE